MWPPEALIFIKSYPPPNDKNHPEPAEENIGLYCDVDKKSPMPWERLS